MRVALVLIAPILICAAHAQVGPTGHAGLNAFSHICFEPRTLNFSLSDEDQARLGFQKDDNVSIIPDDLAKKYNVPESERVTTVGAALMVHGSANEPYAFSTWFAPNRTRDLIQRVDAGRGTIGDSGNSAPARFCSVLTLSNADEAASAFAAAVESAVFVYEKDGILFGHMRVWSVDLPWAPDHVGIVTIANFRSTIFSEPAGMPDAALFVVEVVSASDLQRVMDVIASGDGAI